LALHRWSLTHADVLYSLLRRLLVLWMGEKQGIELSAELVSGLANKTLEIDQELHKLANIACGHAYDASLSVFLTNYGHRSVSLDIYHPNFACDPSQVRGLIEHLKQSEPHFEWQNMAAKHEKACAQVKAAVKKPLQPNPIRWLIGRITFAFFNHILGLVKRYIPLREDQRFYWQKGLAAIRQLFLILGQRLVIDKLLTDGEEIFFTTKDEIENYVKGKKSFSYYQVQSRKREFKQLQKEYRRDPNLHYPTFLRGNRPLDFAPQRKDRFVGQPVSPGIKIGPVRVVDHPAQFNKIRLGDILVTKSTDPGWTPIFAKLGGLIMETGGQLSHGAVVAREYGLPAVSGIAELTRLLKDGQVVKLDGTSGKVMIID
jgi:pyruvate,water dikinase